MGFLAGTGSAYAAGRIHVNKEKGQAIAFGIPGSGMISGIWDGERSIKEESP
jgi:hypothetical protein